MNIADILNPRIPTIDAARVTAHQLPDDGGETKENDMSNHSDVQKAVADCGGRATREEIGTATGFEGKELENAIYNAIKKYGLIRREGKDFVLVKPGSNGTSEAPAKPTKAASKPAKAKPAAKAKKTAAPKPKATPRSHTVTTPARPMLPAAPTALAQIKEAGEKIKKLAFDIRRPDAPEAYLLRDGGLLIVDGSERIHLTQAQYIAVLNTKE